VGSVFLLCVHTMGLLFHGASITTVVIALSGFGYGMSWTSLFHTIDVLFASDPLAITLGMAAGPGIGPLLLNYVVGVLYDREVGKHAVDGTCIGVHCYTTSYQALVIADTVVLVLALTLFLICTRTALPKSLNGYLGKDSSLHAL
jgi:hypothetical protein